MLHFGAYCTALQQSVLLYAGKLCSESMEMSLDTTLSHYTFQDASVALVVGINLLTGVNFRAFKT